MIKFVDYRREKEFNAYNLDIRIRNIALFVAGFAEYIILDSDVVITSIYRTDEEQMRIYGGKMPSFGNIHGDWRAIDFVIVDKKGRDIGPGKAKNIAVLINKYIQHDNKNRYPTCLYHDVGLGEHFHIQVSQYNQTRLRRENG